MFIETDDKGMINVSLCRRIFEKRDEPGVYRFVFSDDDWVDADVEHADIAAIIHQKPVPASSGFFHLKFHGDRTEGLFDKSPVIAWRGDFEYGATPVTLEGDHAWGGTKSGVDRAILLPDGRVLDQFAEIMFSSAEEWATSRQDAKSKAA